MLTVETFTKYVMKNLLSFMPDEYQDCKLQIRKVPKVNEVLTGVVIVPKAKKKSFVSPTFYIERMYEQYTQSGDLEGTMRKQAEYLEESKKCLPPETKLMMMGSDLIRTDMVVFQLVNAAANAEMLKICPHRDFGCLAAVYRIIVSIDNAGVSGFLVTNDIAEVENWSEEYLYELAKTNTPKIFPFTVERIEDTMMRMMKRWGNTDTRKEIFPDYDTIPTEQRTFVISNKYEFFGANVLMFPEEIRKVAEQIGTDVYVLPSSVHDVVVLSDKAFTEKNKLIGLVKSTNADHVRPQDRLADLMWKYTLDTNELTEVVEVVEEKRVGA